MARITRFVALGMVAAIAAGTVAGAAGRRLSTPLSGAEEVDANGNPSGDPNGTGTAVLTLNVGKEQVCYELSWANLDGTVTRAHIHEAPAGQNGGIVVSLFEGQSYPGTHSVSACDLGDGTKEEIRRILADPSAFYVNVHDSVRPAGAVRGQLER